MQKTLKSWLFAPLAVGLIFLVTQSATARKHKAHTDFSEVEVQMNKAAKDLHTVSANLEYTKVTVLVNDKSTETGQLFFARKGKYVDLCIKFVKPDSKVILVKKNRAQIYLPKINQVQQYDMGQQSDLMQQFLLLGFGSEINDLKKSYNIKYLREEDMGDDTTAVLELTPRSENVAAQLVKLEVWISEDSWLPIQQKFYESGGDYLIARYSGMKVDRGLPGSAFDLQPAPGAKHVKMN